MTSEQLAELGRMIEARCRARPGGTRSRMAELTIQAQAATS